MVPTGTFWVDRLTPAFKKGIFRSDDGFGDPLRVLPFPRTGRADFVRMIPLHQLAKGLLDLLGVRARRNAQDLVRRPIDPDSRKREHRLRGDSSIGQGIFSWLYPLRIFRRRRRVAVSELR